MMSDVRRFQIERGDFGKVDDVEAKVKELVDHLKTPGGVRFERPSPSGHYIEVSYKPLDNGTIISIHRNITELKEREASLAAAKEAAEAARADAERTRQSMQTVLDNMNEAVQLFDKDFDIEFVNRRLYEFHAYPPEIRRARRLRLRRHPLHGEARRLWPRCRHREDRRGARRAHSRSERQPPRAAHRQRQPGRVHVQSAARWPRAGGRSRRHRGQAPRRGAAGGGRHPQADQPRPVRSADRARNAGRIGVAAVRGRRRQHLPARRRHAPRHREPRLFAAS